MTNKLFNFASSLILITLYAHCVRGYNEADLSCVLNCSQERTVCKFLNANLSGADLRGVNLEDAFLEYANLTGANLTGAHLSGANLYLANLIGTNLSGADLRRADLHYANLMRANLTRANFFRANLEGAKLYEAILSETNLVEAILTGTNLDDHLDEAMVVETIAPQPAFETPLHQRINHRRAHFDGAPTDDAIEDDLCDGMIKRSRTSSDPFPFVATAPQPVFATPMHQNPVFLIPNGSPVNQMQEYPYWLSNNGIPGFHNDGQ